VIYIGNDKNDGFARGNNIGIEYALSQRYDHVLLINNDTIVTPSFLEPLVERLESDNKIAAVSGKIYYYPDAVAGKDKIIWYAGAYLKWHMAYNHSHEFEVDAGQCDVAGEVAYASGCLMLLRGDVLRKIGGLSEEYFMYWEESDWCLRAKEQGYSSWYEPRSIIYHNTRSSIKGKETPLYTYMMYRNFPIFASHHFHGLKKIWFWFCYPLHIFNRFFICLKAGNRDAAFAIFKGVIDYFKGYRGRDGLKERGLIQA
jgi:GT2 family glycosyltransferase